MPSSVVHVAAALLLAGLCLGEAYSSRAALVVAVAAVVPDVDAFVGLVVPNAHRAALHNAFVPLVLAALLAYDVRVRRTSWLRSRFGPHAPRVAAVAVLSIAFAATGLDFVTNGVNLLYPLHDQFYTFSGRVEFSSAKGLVQTFVQPVGGPASTTHNTHYSTIVNPSPPGAHAATPTRIAPVVESGWQLWLAALGYGSFAWRALAGRA